MFYFAAFKWCEGHKGGDCGTEEHESRGTLMKC